MHAKSYVVLYEAEGDEVVVAQIFHQSQDYARLVYSGGAYSSIMKPALGSFIMSTKENALKQRFLDLPRWLPRYMP